MAGAAVLLIGCEGLDSAAGGGAFSLDQYFEGATAWTWRDELDTGEVDDATVLRGELDEEGSVAVRRGARYADGVAVGVLRWDLSAADLVLSSWAWGDADDDAATIFAREGGASGDTVTNLKGSCVAEAVDELETRYGTFDRALASTCTGTAAPEGTWWFAPGYGLVRVETDVITLDLVAPR